MASTHVANLYGSVESAVLKPCVISLITLPEPSEMASLWDFVSDFKGHRIPSISTNRAGQEHNGQKSKRHIVCMTTLLKQITLHRKHPAYLWCKILIIMNPDGQFLGNSV